MNLFELNLIKNEQAVMMKKKKSSDDRTGGAGISSRLNEEESF